MAGKMKDNLQKFIN